MYKVITLTGLDRTGKATQAKLLAQALSPAKLKSFPDYDHWSGQLIRAILSEEGFEIRRWQGGTKEIITSHQEVKEPYLFQALQFANGRAHFAALEAGLEKHHWVLDRGPACAHAFGRIDGCEPEFLKLMSSFQIDEDLVLVMLGGPYARAGEVPDMNERDPDFQARVKAEYRGLIRNRPGWFEVPLHLVPEGMSREEAITFVHHAICMQVATHFQYEIAHGTFTLAPLTQAEVGQALRQGQRPLPWGCDGC